MRRVKGCLLQERARLMNAHSASYSGGGVTVVVKGKEGRWLYSERVDDPPRGQIGDDDPMDVN